MVSSKNDECGIANHECVRFFIISDSMGISQREIVHACCSLDVGKAPEELFGYGCTQTFLRDICIHANRTNLFAVKSNFQNKMQ